MTASTNPAAAPRTDLPAPVRAMLRLESSPGLDGPAPLLWALGRPLARGSVGRWLRGESSGHALHPPLTDLPIGFWTASLLLDLRGRDTDREASRRLIGAGLLAVAPTAVTGLTEWHSLPKRQARVGTVHALLNVAATGLYVASWAARGKGRQSAGIALALTGATVASVSGYLGGHLAVARKAGSRHAAYADPMLDAADSSAPSRLG